ncbi:hypothetical protein QTP88_023100 [Uroleucon formosanum]
MQSVEKKVRARDLSKMVRFWRKVLSLTLRRTFNFRVFSDGNMSQVGSLGRPPLISEMLMLQLLCKSYCLNGALNALFVWDVCIELKCVANKFEIILWPVPEEPFEWTIRYIVLISVHPNKITEGRGFFFKAYLVLWRYVLYQFLDSKLK